MKKESNPSPPDISKRPPAPPGPPKLRSALNNVLVAIDPNDIFYNDDIDLIRQWFDCVQDVNPQYLEKKDYELAARIYEAIGWRIPNSIKEKCDAV